MMPIAIAIVTIRYVHVDISYVDVPSYYAHAALTFTIDAQPYSCQGWASVHGRLSGAVALIFKPFSP